MHTGVTFSAATGMVFAMLFVARPGAGQGSPRAGDWAQADDSTQAHIRTTLHAFYFNLAHRDWEALAAEILPAKIVAHRPAPAAMVATARDRSGGAALAGGYEPVAACETSGPLVERAAITLDGDWAEVSVPRCPAAGSDEFRLIRFETRWRIVYIELYEEAVRVSAERRRRARASVGPGEARISSPPRR